MSWIMSRQSSCVLRTPSVCVLGSILGSTYNAEFEDVKTLNQLLDQKNKEMGQAQRHLHILKTSLQVLLRLL